MAGLAAAFGSGAMTNSIAELRDSTCLFIIGSDTTTAHPLISRRLFQARKKGAQIIVIDPRKTQITQLADIHVRPNLGKDIALINAIMHVIWKNGWHNQKFIDERTENFEECKAVIEQYPPERAEEITGVKAADIEKIAEMYAKAERGSIVYCLGITEHTTGVDNVKSLANLAMMTGQIGRYGTGVNPLRGQNNVQGACDMGALPDVFPGYQKTSDPAVLEKFSNAWGVPMPINPGLKIPEMFHAMEEGQMKALYLMGENPVLSDPDSKHVIEALKHLELFIAQDIFLNETNELADVIFPAVSYAEQDGTFSNTDRRVQRLHKVIDPIGNSKPDYEIIAEFATRMGYPMKYDSASAIMDEIASVTPSFCAINYDRLAFDSVQWPCTTTDNPGLKFLHEGKFTRGMGYFHGIEHRGPAEVVDEEYPLWLSTGRMFVHYHTTMTQKCPTLLAEVPEFLIEMHPADALARGIEDREKVRIRSRRGELEAKVDLTEKVREGMTFMPFGMGGLNNVNLVTNSATDPLSKTYEYKACAIEIEKIQ